MIIKPNYPKEILRQPYYKGVMTGIIIIAGLMLIYSSQQIIGSLIFVTGTMLYFYQTSEDYNFL